ncbi:MAG: hypothetical protein EXS13_06175 [Planctomycetes bacterium]|nr:hypothetical protein [Planctomycetota bacterium]
MPKRSIDFATVRARLLPKGARLLLFAGLGGGLALESNGLRVLVRLGFAKEQKNWSATWRTVNAAIAPELAAGLAGDAADLAALHLALRRHGQELCTRNKPICGECRLRERCPSAGA